MTFTWKLVEKAKKKQGISSDYAIAKLMNVTPQKISNWKTEQSEANATNTLLLVKLAGIDIDEAIKLSQRGNAKLSLIFMTAIGSIALLTPIVNTLLCILC